MTQSDIDEHTKKEFERQWSILSSNVVEITPTDEFKKMLLHSIQSDKPLRIKCGIDPTNPNIHLGHLVPYKKMRQFQDLGHTGVVVIGDYTAQIGDPTGKNESRKSLSAEETLENAKSYMEQVFTVLDKDKTEVCYQSSWFEKVSLQELLKWASETTVAKLLSHDTFKNRLDDNNTLSLHELFYPVLQGMDSVLIKADVELGGSDQKFNVLMGRDYQKHRNMRPQIAILLPLIMGTDGSQKMSKSLNNYIGIKDEPFDQFGKVMSIPDELMVNYTKYVSGFSFEEKNSFIEKIEKDEIHPNEAKKQLASNIVGFFHGDEVGLQMREQFEKVFAKKKVPDEIPEFVIDKEIGLIDLLRESKLCASNGEARRMLKQNAISIIDEGKINDESLIFNQTDRGKIIKVGKRRFVKLV